MGRRGVTRPVTLRKLIKPKQSFDRGRPPVWNSGGGSDQTLARPSGDRMLLLLLLLVLSAACGGATATECTSASYCPATCSGVPGNASSYVPMAGTEHRLMGNSTGERQLHASVVRMVNAVEKRFGPVTNDTLEVLTPGDGVVRGVADDRADDAAGDVFRAQSAVAEVGGQRDPIGDH